MAVTRSIGRQYGLALSALIAAVGLPAMLPAQDTTKPLGSLPRSERLAAVPAHRALSQTIAELNVDSVPLSRVLDYLRDVSGANMVVNWKVLDTLNITKDTPITLQVNEVPLRKVLRLVLDQASPTVPLVFPIDSNVITITSQEEADKVMVTKVYVVDDLVMTNNQTSQPPSFDLTQITKSGTTAGGSGTTGGGGGGGGGLFTGGDTATSASTEDTTEKRGGDLVKLVTEIVRPNIWRDNGGQASIRYFNGKLIVTAPISVHEAIGGPYLPEGGQRMGNL